MIRVRATFEKCGRAKYISHLDLNRCMLRTFRRSRLPIWYTEGFNPHPYYSFALALSLGFESSCEILDFNLNEELPFDEIKDKLNAVMPEGMRIVKVAEQKQKITAIAKAEYSFSLVSDEADGLFEAVQELIASPEILIEKKTKKGIKTVDIKPDMEILSCTKGEKSVDVTMYLPAGTQTNYNPTLFIEALRRAADISFEPCNIRRTAILCEDNLVFE
ncbi:MAG: TIGR03936 family radical SAM-associated protein [Ruminococcus sp.]|uniref:TIGR03936 family radical SAM-associated protein n=1 Tax=Ruminococcus sp. TaxID=41978 RepID=UPI0025CF5CCE|nr:TIGR03936 family radical SAM-associated protein [Ruminococcus sp.]MCR5601784.1 TIGR03936 family radical SAM-associated protein [Ruminococcus sp.]